MLTLFPNALFICLDSNQPPKTPPRVPSDCGFLLYSGEESRIIQAARTSKGQFLPQSLNRLMTTLFQRFFGRLAYFAPGGYSIRPRLHRWRGVRLGRGVWISQYTYLDELYPEAISIGDNSTIGLRTSIITHLHWGPKRAVDGFKEVVIEDDVFIGPHCLILPGVRVGQGAVVKGGSVLARNVPPRSLWGPPPSGHLGRVTVPLTAQHSYEEFVWGLQDLLPDGKPVANIPLRAPPAPAAVELKKL